MLSLLKVTEKEGLHAELKEIDLLLPVTESGTERQIQSSRCYKRTSETSRLFSPTNAPFY